MHPEIVRDAPGTCPICGMALEPVMPSLDDGENPELTDFRAASGGRCRCRSWCSPLAMFGHRRDCRVDLRPAPGSNSC